MQSNRQTIAIAEDITESLTNRPWFSWPAELDRNPRFGSGPAIYWGSDFVCSLDDIERWGDIGRQLNQYMIRRQWDRRMLISSHTIRLLDEQDPSEWSL